MAALRIDRQPRMEKRIFDRSMRKSKLRAPAKATAVGVGGIVFFFVIDHFFDGVATTFLATLLKQFLPNFKALGIPQSWSLPLRESLSIVIFIVIIAFASVATYLKSLTADLEKLIKESSAEADEYKNSVMELKQLVTAPKREHIVIGLFDRLLIYAPLYIARGMGYFKDEALDVDFKSLGTDESVAAAARSGSVGFAVGDPIYCLEGKTASELTSNRSDLLVLLPIGKRFAITAFGHVDCHPGDLLSRKTIRIGCYEEPSTTYLTAVLFKEWLTRIAVKLASPHKFKVPIEIKQIPAMDPIFQTPDNLAGQMESLDFMLLWEPQTSWVLHHEENSTLRKFGVVHVEKTPTSTRENAFKTVRHNTAEPGAQWKPWSPYTHRCLVSGLMTCRSSVEARPDLNLRVFRALSRSLMNMHSVNWADAPEGRSETIKPLYEAVVTQLASSNDVTERTFKSLAASNRENFPYIEAASEYRPDRYSRHFLNCHELWLRSGISIPKKVQRVEFYDNLFVTRADLSRASG